VLAVLRLIYEEKRGEISLNSFPMITVADVLDKLRALAGFVPKKTRFTLILRRMQSLKLIQLRGDMSSESEMLPYPSLAFAFDSAAVDAFLEQIKTDTDNGAEESDDDQA
jgi:hypothetical protein